MIRDRCYGLSRQTVWFTVLPLIFIVTVIGCSLPFKQATPKEIEVLPWLIALFFVGLPHGAADLAVLRSKKEGRKAWKAFLWYVVSMISVFTIFIFTPAISLIAFLILSLWHFGNSENSKTTGSGAFYEHLLLSFAQGGIVIGMPLAAWPDATSSVATELVTLIEPLRTLFGLSLLAHPIYSASHIASTGFVLLAIAFLSWFLIFIYSAQYSKTHGTKEFVKTCSIFFSFCLIGILEFITSPLFGIGIYFLAFHSWRQMPILAKHFIPPNSKTHPLQQIVSVHKAAIPLLLPTWILLGVAWWSLSDPAHFRDLALLSLLVYLVVTPAHEVLYEWLLTQPETA
jgi:Brp/Blh family beta-carotene 15,15'-monooxygenase